MKFQRACSMAMTGDDTSYNALGERMLVGGERFQNQRLKLMLNRESTM
jgi:hypothetical protein